MKKKLLAVLLSAAMATALTACGQTASEADNTAAQQSQEEPATEDVAEESDVAGAEDETTYNVGIMQLVEHPALDLATDGFQDALKERLKDRVTFDYQNAQGESANCASIANVFVSANVDLIMANATPALQSAAAATGTIPIVGTSITDYITAGVVESNEAPGMNVTGASDLAPVDQQIALLQRIVPDAKKVGIVYCSAEPNSAFQSELATQYLTEAGIEVSEYTCADSNEVQAVVTKATAECDCIYIPTDNTIANNMEIVKNITIPAGMPVICGEENMCAGGGLATLSISYYDMGYAAGEMACEILLNGADPATTPIRYVSDNIVAKYNAEAAEALGIEIPDDLVAIETE